MATECTLKVRRTRCVDVYDSASTEREDSIEMVDCQVMPVTMEQSMTSPAKKSPKQSSSLVKNSNSQRPGRTVNDCYDRSQVLDTLHIDTDLANQKYNTISPGRRCLSDSKVSLYMKKCQNVAVSDCKKRKIYFSESEEEEYDNNLAQQETDSCCSESDREDDKTDSMKTSPRIGVRVNQRQKVDSFAELSAEEYKFRHHIGERNAVEKVVSYNEKMFLKKPLQTAQHDSESHDCLSSPKEENNNTVKSESCTWKEEIKLEIFDTTYSSTENPEASLHKKGGVIDFDTKLKRDIREKKCKEEIFDDQARTIKEEMREISDEDDVFQADPKDITGNDGKETVVSSLKVTKPKTKKVKPKEIVTPAPRKRRIASLTAQTKMQLMYEKDEAKPPKKKSRSTEDLQTLKTEKKVKVEVVDKTKNMKKKHIEEIITDIKKGKKVEKVKTKRAGISVNTMYGNAIRVPNSVGLTATSAIWSQPLNLAVNNVYAVDPQTQFIPLQGTPATVLGDQSTAMLGPRKGAPFMSTKQKVQKTAREKWKKKLANPTQGVRNSSRTASLNAQAVISNASPRKRSLSDPGEYKAKKKKQKLPAGGQWVVTGLGPQYFIPNTGNTVIIGNQSTLPAHATNTVTLLSKKKKSKGQPTLEGLGQQLLASAAGPTNVILPSLSGGNLEANNVPQAITIGGIGSLSTQAYMPVQFTQSSVPQIGQAHFAQGFYQTGSILPPTSVADHCQISPPIKNIQKSGRGGKKLSDCHVIRPNLIVEPKLKPTKKSNTNGWRYQGEPFQSAVFLQNDAPKVMRTCYQSIKRKGEVIQVRDCVLLKSGPRKTDLPYVAKVSALWLDPEEGEIMASLLWYYRPEHIEGGRRPHHHEAELFACKHKDYNSVATIEDKCYVLTLAEYNRHCRKVKMVQEGVNPGIPLVPSCEEEYPRTDRIPSPYVDKDLIYFCRHVYDYRQKRILKNPS